MHWILNRVLSRILISGGSFHLVGFGGSIVFNKRLIASWFFKCLKVYIKNLNRASKIETLSELPGRVVGAGSVGILP